MTLHSLSVLTYYFVVVLFWFNFLGCLSWLTEGSLPLSGPKGQTDTSKLHQVHNIRALKLLSSTLQVEKNLELVLGFTCHFHSPKLKPSLPKSFPASPICSTISYSSSSPFQKLLPCSKGDPDIIGGK